MKKIIYLIIFLSLNTFAQDKYLTKTGTVNFEASISAFEEIKATNNSVTSIINTKNGEFATLILVKGFRFKNALMEEHFNENYAESDTYPKATFKGNVIGFSLKNLESKSTFKINGKLTFHGKTKQLTDIPLTIKKEKDIILISGNFKVNVSDFDIKIPKILKKKVSKEVNIIFNFSLKKK